MSDHISPRRSTQSTHRRPAPPLPPDQKLSILRHEQVYELLHTAQRVGVHLYQLWCAPDLFEDSSSHVDLRAELEANAETIADLQDLIMLAAKKAISPSDPRPGQIDLSVPAIRIPVRSIWRSNLRDGIRRRRDMESALQWDMSWASTKSRAKWI
ncbi:hypothetical protein DOTSEDRAFT_38669 [Dothistroma septosporum NZE10]|uniref:Uncharacterized protein n=1 Tax=Dothistroma septosporum (strain NZE10 / CBS 128990) TaxID=675120 RepID=M2WKI6_DOTSN|nr:hypothetical protein DOTSEDRAFT_38669 [Dothistroma septosporum NZE10]